jgi:uncharacterized Zn ribbon protein
MKEYKNKIICLLTALLILSCANLKKQKLINKADYYRTNYGIILQKQDTIIRIKDLQLKYANGYLTEVGNIKNEIKYDEWYYFYDSLKIDYIINYKENKIDTLIKPFVLINKSW